MNNNDSNGHPANPVLPPSATEDIPSPIPSTSEYKVKFIPELLEDAEIFRSGAFGSIYKARSTAFKRTCAVKVIRRFREGKDLIREIRNEAEMLNELNHPSIIETLGEWEDPHNLYIMLEFAHKGDLRDLIHRTIITEEHARRIILDIGSALEYIHDKNIIHRDVKLENVLITEKDEIKLADFGLAVKTKHGFAFGDCGTPDTKAPEVLLQVPCTKAIDWWALGIILCEMVSLGNPFEPFDEKPLEYNILRRTPTISGLVSRHCYDLMTKLLEKDKKLRIQSLKELTSQSFFHST